MMSGTKWRIHMAGEGTDEMCGVLLLLQLTPALRDTEASPSKCIDSGHCSGRVCHF